MKNTGTLPELLVDLYTIEYKHKDKQSLAQVAGVLSEKPNVGITALDV